MSTDTTAFSPQSGLLTVDWFDRISEQVGTWHRSYFPDVYGPTRRPELVALKLCEEAGEVASAVGNLATNTRRDTDWHTKAAEEMGDVFAALVALAAVLDIDLRAAIEAKVCEVTARQRGSAKEDAR